MSKGWAADRIMLCGLRFLLKHGAIVYQHLILWCFLNLKPFIGRWEKFLALPVEPRWGQQTVVRAEHDFLPATQSDCSTASLYQLFIPFSNLSLRCCSVYLLNLPHKQLNDGLLSPGNRWPPGDSKLKWTVLVMA